MDVLLVRRLDTFNEQHIAGCVTSWRSKRSAVRSISRPRGALRHNIGLSSLDRSRISAYLCQEEDILLKDPIVDVANFAIADSLIDAV